MSDHILWETINEQKQKITELGNELRYQEQAKRIAEKAVVDLTDENKNLKTRLNAINLLTPELEKLSKDKDNKLVQAKDLLKRMKCAYSSLVREVGVAVYPPDVYFEIEKFLED